jgi:uncharacterized membrane protein YciS (DUF1049 family)
MNKILIFLFMIFAAFICGYFYGQAQLKIKMSDKKAEVIKHDAQKRAHIQAEPNASRDDLLKLMRKGEL